MQVDTYISKSRTLLEQCEAVFNQYAVLHRAKGTPEGDEKAVRNERMAARIREFLDTP